MALSEIEKLERRYAENPQGLTFAPLAEVHRKNGEVARALDCWARAWRSIPTTSRPASCWAAATWIWATSRPPRRAFLHVLALDGENVIALKALADISERLLQFDEAERWLRTLLSVDRSNDDARDQLAAGEVARRQAEVASSAEPSKRGRWSRRDEAEPSTHGRAARRDHRRCELAPFEPPSRSRAGRPRLEELDFSPLEAGAAPEIRELEELELTSRSSLEAPDGRSSRSTGLDRPRSGRHRMNRSAISGSRPRRTSSSRARAEANSRCRTRR